MCGFFSCFMLKGKEPIYKIFYQPALTIELNFLHLSRSTVDRKL